jgi:hypothetical protein
MEILGRLKDDLLKAAVVVVEKQKRRNLLCNLCKYNYLKFY